MKGIPHNHAQSIEVTWCPFRKEEFTSRFEEDKFTSHFKNRKEKVTSRLKKVQHDLPKKECVEGKCVMCGVMKYERNLINKNRFLMRKNNAVTWQQWDKV